MNRGDRVVINVLPCATPETNAADTINGANAVVFGWSPDGQWVVVVVNGEMCKRYIRPERLQPA